MAYNFATPNTIQLQDIGLALTFIVPARKCNLSCSFCVIDQRKESLNSTLSKDDYITFLEDMIANEPVSAVAIQGHEPLLPEAWPYTKAIMEVARQHKLPRSFITNGICLEERIDDIIALDPTGISISIDSANDKTHNQLRGKTGALSKTVNGLKNLVKQYPDFAKKITIASVLFPNRRPYLHDMPQLLSEIGLNHWSISPVVRIGQGKLGGHIQAWDQIVSDMKELGKHAEDYNISLMLDDELQSLPLEKIEFDKIVIRSLERPDGLIRLNPNGACSIGTEILQEVGEHTSVWRPSESSPSEFIENILKITAYNNIHIAS